MKKGFSPSRAAAQLPGPRPKPARPASAPAARSLASRLAQLLLRRPRPTPRFPARRAAPAFTACLAATRRPYTGGEGRCPLRPAELRLQGCPSARSSPRTPRFCRLVSLPLAPQQQQRTRSPPSLPRRRRAPPPALHSSIHLARSSASPSSFACAHSRLPSSR